MRTSDVVMCLGFVLLLAGILIPTVSPTEEIKTDCYDRYGSQIEDLECTKTIISNEWLPIISILSIMFGLMAIVASFFISFEEMMRR